MSFIGWRPVLDWVAPQEDLHCENVRKAVCAPSDSCKDVSMNLGQLARLSTIMRRTLGTASMTISLSIAEPQPMRKNMASNSCVSFTKTPRAAQQRQRSHERNSSIASLNAQTWKTSPHTSANGGPARTNIGATRHKTTLYYVSYRSCLVTLPMALRKHVQHTRAP